MSDDAPVRLWRWIGKEREWRLLSDGALQYRGAESGNVWRASVMTVQGIEEDSEIEEVKTP